MWGRKIISGCPAILLCFALSQMSTKLMILTSNFGIELISPEHQELNSPQPGALAPAQAPSLAVSSNNLVLQKIFIPAHKPPSTNQTCNRNSIFSICQRFVYLPEMTRFR